MGDSAFTIQISTKLVNKLVDDSAKLTKKTKRPKPKSPREAKTPQQLKDKLQEKQILDDSKMLKAPPTTGWPLQPLFAPTPPPPPPPQSASAELDAIRSALLESEKVVERLQKQEDHMLEEVTQRAKDLHAKEFKLPEKKPMPCLEKSEALFRCYKEHLKDPLPCASLVKEFSDCARRARQEMRSLDK